MKSFIVAKINYIIDNMGRKKIFGRCPDGKICKRFNRFDVNGKNCKTGSFGVGFTSPSKARAFDRVEAFLRRGCTVTIEMVE